MPARLLPLLAAAGLFACTYHPIDNGDVEVRSARFGRTVTIDGFVIHQLTEQPIAGAEIELDCQGWTRHRRLTTDANGAFHARGLPPGACNLCARAGADDIAHGFTARPGQRARITFRLLPTRVFDGNPCGGQVLTRARSAAAPA